MSAGKAKKTLQFTSRHSCLEEWVRSFASHLETSPEKNAITYPDSFATGFANVHSLEEGLVYRVVNYRLNTDYVFIRKPINTFYLILYFYQYADCEKLSLKIDNEVIIESDEKTYSTLLMTNSLVLQELSLTKGTYVRGLTIQLTEEWLMEKIAQPHQANLSFFKEKNVFQKLLNAKTQKLLNEIFANRHDVAAPNLYKNTRVLRLLEAFLENIFKNGFLETTLPTSAADLQNVLKIESILLEKYDSEFPSIEKLAQIALMSKTKLKNIFKKAFGMGMYEYYQKNRMHKAMELLNTGKYSVSEVGSLIGYQNLSNFSKSFKKEFQQLPKDSHKVG